MTSYVRYSNQRFMKRVERDDINEQTAIDRYRERQRIAQEQHIKRGADTAPLNREWVGLTKEEFEEAVEGLEDLYDCWAQIEQALKDKNT